MSHPTVLHALLPALLLAAAAAAGACSEIGTDPGAAVSINFDSLPAPAVVEGDTLRDDSTGVATPLAAVAFNASGGVVANAPFTYVVRDTGGALHVVSGNYLVARKPRTADVTVLATLGSVQFARAIAIVPRPDSLFFVRDDTLALAYPDTATVRTKNLATDGLGVRVVHDTSTFPADTVGVRSWIVFFSIDSSAGTPAAKLADSVWLTDAAGRQTSIDTTDTRGVATIHVRVFAKQQPATVLRDSVIVRAIARYKGADLPTGRPDDEPQRLVLTVVGGRP